MLAATLATLAIALAAPAAPDAPSPEDRAAYREARDAAGRDPDAHVRLALWCEQHGMPAERIQHLALAVMADPAHAAARGLMGLVRDGDAWRKPAEVVAQTRQDPDLAATLAEYDRRRDAADPKDADGQWELAQWCEANGLKEQARAHLALVVQLEPGRDAAWRHLGYKKVGDRWVTDAQLAAERADRDAQEAADRRWKPRLAKWRDQLSDPRKQAEARSNLAAVADPRAVPAVWSTFVANRRPNHALAAQILGQIDARDASRALAALAMGSDSEEARRRAVESLRARDPREFADLVIALIRKPIRYEVKPVGGPGSPGVLFVEGKEFNVRRLYSPPNAPPLMPGDQFLGYDAQGGALVGRNFGPTIETPYNNVSGMLGDMLSPSRPHVPTAGEQAVQQQIAQSGLDPRTKEMGRMFVEAAGQRYAYELTRTPLERAMTNPFVTGPLPLLSGPDMPINSGTLFSFVYQNKAIIPIGQMRNEARKAAAVAQSQLEADIAAIEAINAPIAAVNERAVGILRTVSGLDLEADQEAWARWYVDQLGYRYQALRRGGSTTPTTVTEFVPLAYIPRELPVGVVAAPVAYRRISCFGAGTLVHTRRGPVPIESIRVGDLVLCQDTGSGALDYEPVLVTHHNPPSATLEVKLGEETIVASTFHRFWKAGEGWTMARDLKPGDVIRTLEGLRPVAAIAEGPEQPVFNLDVAGGHTFLVGDSGVLVHDNTVPDLRAEPFDRPAEIARAEAPTP